LTHRDTGTQRRHRGEPEWLVDVFGKGNVYAEFNVIFNREREARNQAVLEVARRLALPLLPRTAFVMRPSATRSDRRVHPAFANHVRLETAGPPTGYKFRALSEIPEGHVATLCDLPEAIHNTTDSLRVSNLPLRILVTKFPKYPVPPGETMTSFLRQRTEGGAGGVTQGSSASLHMKGTPPDHHELRLIENSSSKATS